MKANKFYKAVKLSGMSIYVDAILSTTPEKTRALVSWWRTDDRTGKRIDMDLQQEMVVLKEQEDDWQLMDDSIEKRVAMHWRPG